MQAAAQFNCSLKLLLTALIAGVPDDELLLLCLLSFGTFTYSTMFANQEMGAMVTERIEGAQLSGSNMYLDMQDAVRPSGVTWQLRPAMLPCCTFVHELQRA